MRKFFSGWCGYLVALFQWTGPTLAGFSWAVWQVLFVIFFILFSECSVLVAGRFRRSDSMVHTFSVFLLGCIFVTKILVFGRIVNGVALMLILSVTCGIQGIRAHRRPKNESPLG